MMRYIWRMSIADLGKSIRKLRETQRLSQASLARATGIALRTLTRLESGDPAVRIGTFEKAAHALGLRLALVEVRRRRPTLEELDALYRDDAAEATAPAAAPHPDRP